jgi:hypothetical protein
MPAPTIDELCGIVAMIDEVVDDLQRDNWPVVHATLALTQLPTDDPLPYLFDYLETRRCKVVNVFTTPKQDTLFREIVIRYCGPRAPWDGSI